MSYYDCTYQHTHTHINGDRFSNLHIHRDTLTNSDKHANADSYTNNNSDQDAGSPACPAATSGTVMWTDI